MPKSENSAAAEGADLENVAEVLPLADDDAPEQVAVVAEAEAAPAEAEPARQPQTVEDPRADAVKRYREMRDAANKPAEAAGAAETDTETDQGTDRPAESPVDKKATETAKAGAAAAEKPAKTDAKETPQEPEYTLIIDGKQVKKTTAEVIALAQVAAASDNRLDESKRLVKEATEILRRATEHQPAEPDRSSPQPKRTTAKAEPEHQPDTGDEADTRLKIAERIQTGSTDEGAEAIQELEDRIVSRVSKQAGVDPKVVREQVKAENVEIATTTEKERALTKFREAYPDLASDEILGQAATTVLRRELISDLKSAGVTDEDLAPIIHDNHALAAAQRHLRVSGVKLRSYDDLLGAVGKTMSDKFGIKAKTSDAPQPTTTRPPVDPAKAAQQSRIDHKRAQPQQPRTAGVRTALPEAPRPKTKAEIVAEMRKGRGFSPNS